MKKTKVVLAREWANFKGSERGVFFIYGILILAWSFFPLNKELGAGPVWWLFFSVIISGNFSNSAFISERLSGSMEILLTSGFSRNAVFFGKIAFVLIMSMGIGIACFSLSFVWLSLSGMERVFSGMQLLVDAFLFIVGVCMNVTFGAWLSLRLQSPRIIPFLTIMVMGLVVAAFYCMSFFLGTPAWVLGAIMAGAAGIFGTLAKKEFHGEKVIQPIHL